MVYETVVGRNRKDLSKHGNIASGFIGKHIVGTGEDAHLTTRVMFDFLSPHVALITGKRGSGKSYDAAVIAEEMAALPTEYRQNTAIVFVDTMGIFWSLKNANEEQRELLAKWDLQPKATDNVKIFVPQSQIEEFERADIPIDGGISIAPHEFSAEEWRLAFDLKSTEPAGVALEKTVNELTEKQGEKKFTIDDMISKVRDDSEISDDIKDVLVNMLSVAAKWGVFGTEGISIDDIVAPGGITIIDVSHLRATEAWSVRNLIVAIIARKLYRRRLLARKEEEVAKISGDVDVDNVFGEDGNTFAKKSFPMVWLIIDEAHNFAPSDRVTVSNAPLSTIAKQGREPGVSLVVITQMPNKVHQDILSQCDIVFAHRLTSRDDLEALHSVMQTYMSKELWQYINTLPRDPGACILLDDNLEKVFTIQIRPRVSHHAGGTAVLV